jgi:hypothetical protein
MTEILKDGARIQCRVPHRAEPIVLARQGNNQFVFLFGDRPSKEARTQLEPVTAKGQTHEYFRANAQ